MIESTLSDIIISLYILCGWLICYSGVDMVKEKCREKEWNVGITMSILWAFWLPIFFIGVGYTMAQILNPRNLFNEEEN